MAASIGLASPVAHVAQITYGLIRALIKLNVEALRISSRALLAFARPPAFTNRHDGLFLLGWFLSSQDRRGVSTDVHHNCLTNMRDDHRLMGDVTQAVLAELGEHP